MAIRIIEGVPGSGKTYYAVHHLVRSYFRWSDDIDKYELVDDERKVRVVSNIERFSMAEDLGELVNQAGGLAKFFSFPYQKRLAETHRLVYVIDEAQSLFGKAFRNVDVFLFFQKHRHLGMDVYLITQDVATLAPELRNLAEFYVRAGRRSFSLGGEFRYTFLGSAGDRKGFRTKTLRRDPRIFGLYSSMMAAEAEGTYSATARILATFGLGGLIVALGLVYYVTGYRWARSADAAVPKAWVGSEKHTVGPAVPPGAPQAARAAVAVAPATSSRRETVEATIRASVGSDDRARFLLEHHGRREWVSIHDVISACRCYPLSRRLGARVAVYADLFPVAPTLAERPEARSAAPVARSIPHAPLTTATLGGETAGK